MNRQVTYQTGLTIYTGYAFRTYSTIKIPVNDICSLSFLVLTGVLLVKLLVHYSPSVTAVRMLPQFLPTGACCYYPAQAPVPTLGTRRRRYTHPHIKHHTSLLLGCSVVIAVTIHIASSNHQRPFRYFVPYQITSEWPTLVDPICFY